MNSLAFNRSLQSIYHYITAFHHDNIFHSYFVMIKECQWKTKNTTGTITPDILRHVTNIKYANKNINDLKGCIERF